MLSSVITYILVEYGSKRLLKVFQPLLVVGILFHVMCHLLMCLVTFSPVEKVRVLEKRESDKNRFTTYFGEVYIKTQEASFLKAFLVGLAPSFLSYWFFMYLLDVLLNTHVHRVTLFFLIFLMISLFFSANPSHTDLELIPETFDNNVINSLYQLLLIFLSGLITWQLIRTYNLQLPHEIFTYLIIAGFYFLLKYGFKMTRYILSSINTERNKPTLSPKRRLKSYSRPKYNLFKKLKKKKSIVKRSHLKRLSKRNEKKEKFTRENVVRQTKKHMKQLDKKSEFKEEKFEGLINKDNDIIQEDIHSFANNEMSNKKSQINNNDSSNNNFKNKLISSWEWGNLRDKLINEIHNFLIFNKSILSNDFSLILKNVKEYLERINILNNLQDRYLDLIPKYIHAVYLILTDYKNLNISKLQRLTELGEKSIYNILEALNLKLERISCNRNVNKIIIRQDQKKIITDYLIDIYNKNPSYFLDLTNDKIEIILTDLIIFLKLKLNLSVSVSDFEKRQKEMFRSLIKSLPSIFNNSINITKTDIMQKFFNINTPKSYISEYLNLLDVNKKFKVHEIDTDIKRICDLDDISKEDFLQQTKNIVYFILQSLSNQKKLDLYINIANELLDKFRANYFNNISEIRANPYILAGAIVYLTPHQLEGDLTLSTSKIVEVLKKVNLTRNHIMNFIYYNFQDLNININYRLSPKKALNLVKTIFDYIYSRSISFSELNSKFDDVFNYLFNSFIPKKISRTKKRFFEKVIHDFIYLITYLKKLNNRDIDQFIFLRDLAKDIISKKIADFLFLNNFNIDHLVKYLKKIINFLKDSYPEYFNLRSRGNQNSLNDFDLNYIRLYRKKKKVFTDTFQFDSYNGFFTKTFYGKCEFSNCNIGISMLPTLEFDHLELSPDDPEYLEFSRIILNHNYDKIRELVQSQFGGFDILCRNHHHLKSASLYNPYYSRIYLDYLYYNKNRELLSIKEFEYNLIKYKEELIKLFDKNTVISILSFIKKKYIIEYLFGKDYKCCICNLVSINDNLPAFCFHHMLPEIKENEFNRLISESDDINFINKSIIQEECVCICASDHSMINSEFFRMHYDKIVGKSFKEEIESYYQTINSNLELQYQMILKLKENLSSNSILDFI